MSTVREMIAEIQADMLSGDMHGDQASDLLMRATSLLGNCFEETRAAEAAYAAVLLKHLDGEEKANRAKIRAETTPEYRRKQEARDLSKLLDEIIKSFKIVLRQKTEEAKLTR